MDHPDWENEVLRLTNGKGAEHIVDVVGGDSINHSLAALTQQGYIYLVGYLKSTMAEVDLIPLLTKQARLQGIYVGHRKSFDEMNKVLEELNIKPVIDTIYPFLKATEAFEHLGRGAFGKIVIRISE